MNTPQPPLDPASVPFANTHTTRRARLPLVWLVPAIAAFIGGWIAVHALLERGPTITVAFADAEGIETHKTKIRYRNVDVGEVQRISLASDLHTVIVSIEVAKFASPLLKVGARFWVVRPRLGAGGVSGLGTLLSGDYIGMDVGTGPESAREFIGLTVPPVIAGDTAGTELILEARDQGSLSVGAPAYFKHVSVGHITSTVLNSDGRGVTLRLFVEKPYDRFISNDTRFWHASGVDVAFDGSGVRVRTESLATLVAGGIAFETPPSSSEPLPADPETHFHLAATRESAMKAADRVAEPYILYFNESLRGLERGATVDFHGVEIGEVDSLRVEYDRAQKRFRFPVLINMYPDRIREHYLNRANPLISHAIIAQLINQGLRAQLRSSSFLTGQLYVALDFFPRATKLLPQPQLSPMPVPTVEGNLEKLQAVVLGVAEKLNQLPLRNIGQNTDRALASLNSVLGSAHGFIGNLDSKLLPEAESAVSQARLTLAQTGEAIGPEATLQTDIHSTLTSVTRAADSIRVLADYLEKHPESLIRGKGMEQP